MPYNPVFLDHSLESIAQQSPEFFEELKTVVDKIIGKKRSEIHASSFSKDIAACVKKHMSATIDVNIGSEYGAGADDPMSISYYTPTVNHPAFADRAAATSNKIVKIKTDDKTARIHGDISLFEPCLNLDTGLIEKNILTSGEIAAIMTHEFGHLYYTFSLIGQYSRLMYALHDVCRDFNQLTRTQRVVQLSAVSLEHNTPGVNVDELADNGTGETVVLAYYTELMHRVRSELGTEEYDKSMFEYLADQFAARHGAGRDLVTGLDKLYREFRVDLGGFMARRTAGIVSRVFTGLTFLALAAIAPAGTTAAAVITAFAGVIGLVSAGIRASGFKKLLKRIDASEAVYDRDKQRLTRIRDQMQLRMRQGKLSKSEKESYLLDIQTIDEIIKSTINKDMAATLLGRIYGMANKRVKQSELINTFERLAYNHLHDRAFELSTLSN